MLQHESSCRAEEAITGPTQATESKDVQSVTRRQDFANGETLDSNQGGTCVIYLVNDRRLVAIASGRKSPIGQARGCDSKS
jgi:hypothetical protein